MVLVVILGCPCLGNGLWRRSSWSKGSSGSNAWTNWNDLLDTCPPGLRYCARTRWSIWTVESVGRLKLVCSYIHLRVSGMSNYCDVHEVDPHRMVILAGEAGSWSSPHCIVWISDLMCYWHLISDEDERVSFYWVELLGERMLACTVYSWFESFNRMGFAVEELFTLWLTE